MSQNKSNESYKQNKALDIKIIIAAHKKYRMPQDDIYIPLHVGAEGKESIGYQAIIPEKTYQNLILTSVNLPECTGCGRI